MQQNIDPRNQTVISCLRNKSYYIDFYQREYVWSKETVETLLIDIFYAFELSYQQHKDSELSPELLEKFNWYYLNIFITNNIDGKVYIVDGQQRLSTLTLIATKLYHMVLEENLKDTLKDCIFGKDMWKGNVYRLDHEKRKDVMECIFSGGVLPEKFKNKTEETIIGRYQDISKFFDNKNMDEHKIKCFVYYFLNRLVLVELGITKDDTPMIFEVINDRGEALKPFEILKGKLVGALSKDDTELFSEKWDKAMSVLIKTDEAKQERIQLEDDFFVDYLKSRFIFKRNSKLESAINNAYHRYIFEHNEIADALKFRKSDLKQIESIKNFINLDLEYYSKLYHKIRNNEDEFLKYNNTILSLSGQYQVILAACNINDSQENEKIQSIAKEYDRLFVLLTLNRVYNSNTFQEISYSLNEKIRGRKLEDYRSIFDEVIKEAIRERRGMSEVCSVLDYQSFLKADYTNIEKRSLRYILARVEKFICDGLGQKMKNDVIYISTKTSYKMGYHIEHILSRNETNKNYFDTEDEFENKRNLLGGLLLLMGQDNISSGNEEYSDKLKTYSSGLIWGHTLCEDFYHTNKKMEEFNKFLKQTADIVICSHNKFDKEVLESRSKVLFELIKIIWEI